jgi:DNA polymerase
MKKIFLDFETFYSREYTLKQLTPVEYIMHPNFEMLGCGVIVENGTPKWMPQERVVTWLRSLQEPYCAITHNALFDATILAWRYGIHPKILIDTMGMARALLAHKLKQSRVSLGNVLEYYHLESKLTTIKDMVGVNFAQLSGNAELYLRFVTYTLRDVRGCREIYNNLIDQFPAAELRVMDRLIRMVTQPQLVMNIDKMRDYYKDILSHKHDLITKLGYNKARYMSNNQFAELLQECDVDPPRKISPTTGKETWALAKNDQEFIALQDHFDPVVRELVEARLGLKSTIEETRTARFIEIARCQVIPWLPVPLKYSGAHTHRFSGDWRLNMQNLSARKTKVLRSTIEAPPGYKILAVDASQIEARLVAWLAGQQNLLEQFRAGADVYSWFGSQVYGYPINKQSHPIERFNSKTIVLGLGFGMSANKLLFTLRHAAHEASIVAEYTLEQCQEWVSFYRGFFSDIPYLWRHAQGVLNYMIQHNVHYIPSSNMHIGPCYADEDSFSLPSGLKLYYKDLEFDGEEATYQYGSMRRKIYGAKLIENIVQALDRQHVIEANMRIENRTGIKLAMQVHDENVYVVNCAQLEEVKQIALEEMSRSPSWAPDIPLAAEAKTGDNYGELI